MKKKILIVEDEAIIALNYKMALQKSYEITGILDTGKGAIEAVERIFPDLILMDIKIKGDMDGIETAQEILNMQNVPIFFLSGNTDEETKKQALKINSCEYIKKPVDHSELLTKIKTILE
ncbi:MAG: response regulator [Spirochaetales bacterium]|nr:response regulator [Spirochaetales bacterium]